MTPNDVYALVNERTSDTHDLILMLGAVCLLHLLFGVIVYIGGYRWYRRAGRILDMVSKHAQITDRKIESALGQKAEESSTHPGVGPNERTA